MSNIDIMIPRDANHGAESSQDEPKDARLELRSTATQKNIIERAASLLGESVTSFVLSTVLRDAVKVINQNEITELSMQDWGLFNELMDSGDKPNQQLIEAVKDYRNRVAHSDGF